MATRHSFTRSFHIERGLESTQDIVAFSGSGVVEAVARRVMDDMFMVHGNCSCG